MPFPSAALARIHEQQERQERRSMGEALLLAVEAEECRRSFKLFVKATWPLIEPVPFRDGWVIDAIVEHLEATMRGDIKRLLVNIPPRHSKSTLISVMWPIWVWLHDPAARFLCASYSFGLSMRDNGRKRRIIDSPWFQDRYSREIQLRPDSNSKGLFENTASGYQMAISVAGGTTGQGGSYLTLDDPHNADEAYSEADRTTALNWFREVWTNRLNNQETDKMVVVGQRIHDNDVCGYIIAERPDWIHLNLPAFFEPARKCCTSIGWCDPRSEEGELLWPERFSKATLEGLQRDLGTNGFSAQYQQSPTPATGGQFKEAWFRYCSIEGDYYVLETPEGLKRVAIADCWNVTEVDLAISSKEGADFTVIQTWAITPEHDALLIDQVRGHHDNPAQQKAIHTVYLFHRPRFVKIEATAYQLALVQQLLKQGVPCREYHPVKDKVARSSTASVLMEAGKMYFLKTLADLHIIKEELLHFPFGAHDDIVDTCSMAAEEVGMPRHGGGMLTDDTPELLDINTEDGKLTATDEKYASLWR